MDFATTLAVAETIHGWMTTAELTWLFHTARALPPRAAWAELGVWQGRSLFTVAMGLPPGATLIAVDSFTPTVSALPFVPTGEWVFDHFQAVRAGIERLRSDLCLKVLRQDTALAAESIDNTSVDVVFFDGDHSREGLARDILAWQGKLRHDGLLCGHDYSDGFPGLIEFVDEAFPQREIVFGTSIWHARAATSNLVLPSPPAGEGLGVSG